MHIVQRISTFFFLRRWTHASLWGKCASSECIITSPNENSWTKTSTGPHLFKNMLYPIFTSDFTFSYRFLECVGVFITSVALLKTSYFVLWNISYHIWDFFNFGYLRPDSIGKWAVVTGGTDGIGKAYAEELARKGFSICIISRNADKLSIVAKELEEHFQVNTKTIHADFTELTIYEDIEKELKELEGGIGVLVNNVGMSYKYAEYFHKIQNGEKFMMDLIHSNITSCTMMMRMVLPEMLKSKGIIINISSLLSVYPMPYLATYAACKAYVDYLSKAVQYEYRQSRVIVQSVLPGYVATKMSNRRPRLEVPLARSFVSSAIKTIGYEGTTYGYIAHRVRGFVHEWLRAHMPTFVNMAIACHVMRKNRESYYRKQKERSTKNELAKLE